MPRPSQTRFGSLAAPHLCEGDGAGDGLALQDAPGPQLREQRQVRRVHQAVGVSVAHQEPRQRAPLRRRLVREPTHHLNSVAASKCTLESC